MEVGKFRQGVPSIWNLNLSTSEYWRVAEIPYFCLKSINLCKVYVQFSTLTLVALSCHKNEPSVQYTSLVAVY